MSRFQELYDEFQAAGAQVLGLSVDSPFAAGAYAQELGLSFPLLGDFPYGKTGKVWGILNEERGVTARMTYVIDREGIVRQIIDAPRDFALHAEQSLEQVKALAAESADQPAD